MPTAIIKCTCTSDFQDKEYGKGYRLANMAGSRDSAKWRCTVCGKEHSDGSKEVVKKNR